MAFAPEDPIPLLPGLNPVVPATAAAIPHEQLVTLSKSQLLQSATVLHAGYTAAQQRVHSLEMYQEVETIRRSHDTAERNAELLELQRSVHQAQTERKRMAEQYHQLETSYIELRRAFKDSPKNPELAKVKAELLEMTSRVIELERLVRKKEPIDVAFLKIRCEELETQHESDKLRQQEAALEIVKLQQKLQFKDAESAITRAEATALQLQEEEAEKEASRSRKRFGAVATAAVAASRTAKRLGVQQSTTLVTSSLPEDLTKPIEVENSIRTYDTIGTQTDAFLLKALDIIGQKNDEIDKLQDERLELNETVSKLESEMDAMKLQIRMLEQSEKRKEQLLDDITNLGALKGGGRKKLRQLLQATKKSIASMNETQENLSVASDDGQSPEGDTGEDKVSSVADDDDDDITTTAAIAELQLLRQQVTDRVELSSKLKHTDALLNDALTELNEKRAKLEQVEAQLEKVTKSFGTVAEENVQLNHSLQTVAGAGTREIEVMMKAIPELQRTRQVLAETQAQLSQAKVNKQEMDKVTRENGILLGRVEKSRDEVAKLITENSQLSKELQIAYKNLEELGMLVKNLPSQTEGENLKTLRKADAEVQLLRWHQLAATRLMQLTLQGHQLAFSETKEEIAAALCDAVVLRFLLTKGHRNK